MAFKALPKPSRHFGRTGSNDITVGVFKPNNNTVFSLPRAVLREAGLSDIPGSTFDLLVGEGDDAGTIAIIAGPRFRAVKVGSGDAPVRVTIGTTMLAASPISSCACKYEIGRKQIIVTLPAGFTFRKFTEKEAAGHAERATPALAYGAAA